jgi:hypothetical protein
MSQEEQQEEIMFSEELLDQKEKTEQECEKLQTLIERESSNTSFIWNPDNNSINIVENFFQKTKRIREDEDDDDDGYDNHHDDDDEDNDDDELAGTSESEDVPGKVIYEVKRNKSPPSFIPSNYVHHHNHTHKIQMHKIGEKKHVPNNDVLDNSNVRRSQTPEHVPWGSQSPETPWSQQREHVLVSLNSDPVDIPNTYYYPTGKGLFFLFIILYIFIFSYLPN